MSNNGLRDEVLNSLNSGQEMLKKIYYSIVCILGNPFNQLFGFQICVILGWGRSRSASNFTVNIWGFIFILVILFLIRYFVYGWFLKVKDLSVLKFRENKFLQLFIEIHGHQIWGLILFYFWIAPSQATITGLVLFPITLVLGSITSFKNFQKVSKMKNVSVK